MTRAHLEHIIRAAAEIADDSERSWPSQMAVFQKKRSPIGFGITVREVP